MKVIVDIPNWLYNAIMEHKEPHYSKSLGEAVRDGTPLPKGHGKLGDLDSIMNDINDSINEMTNIGISVDGQYLWAKLNDVVDNAPVIIEADKEGEE